MESLSLTEAGVTPTKPAPSKSAIGFGPRLLRSFGYLWTTEVHAYAFSIAANALLSFFPFSLLLLTVCRSWLRWQGAYDVIVELLRVNLPTGADFVLRNLSAVMRVRRQAEVASVLLLFLTSSGVFLPLEVALNRIWGIRRNRSYLGNLAVSVVLAVLSAMMAFAAVAVGAITALPLPSSTLHSTASGAMLVLSRAVLETVSLPLMIGVYFLVYWVLPNGRIPVARALPAALIAALMTEAVRWVFIWLLPFLHFPEVYGPFAISATLLIWSFLGSLILLWGASLFADGPLRGTPQNGPRNSRLAASVLDLEA